MKLRCAFCNKPLATISVYIEPAVSIHAFCEEHKPSVVDQVIDRAFIDEFAARDRAAAEQVGGVKSYGSQITKIDWNTKTVTIRETKASCSPGPVTMEVNP